MCWPVQIGKTPIRRLLSQEAICPCTPLLSTFFALCAAWHTPPPTCGRRRLPVFFPGVSAVEARAIHHQDARPLDVSLASHTSAPGTCRAPANRRFPAVSSCPRQSQLPVVGRFDDYARDVCLMRGSWLQEGGQMVGEASVIDHLVLLIE